MATIFRVRRRATGLPGAPSGLLNGELAFNEVDNILYYGKGVSSGVDAATVEAVGGAGLIGTLVTLGTTQTITGDKTFSGVTNVPTVTGGDNSTKAASTAWVRIFAQPLSTSLTAIAAVSTFGSLHQTSSGVYATRVLTGTSGRVSITNGDGVGGNPTVDLDTSGIGAGTYTKLTVDIYGRATVGASLASGDVTTALGFTPENVSAKGAANGYAGLDAGGKVPIAQLPSSVTGGLNYQGVWDASTNTPTLANGVGTKGYYYKVSVAGSTTIDGSTNWSAGDMIIFNGTTWDKAEGGSPDVISVAGRVGAVVLANTDISGLGTMSVQNSGAVSITGGTIAASVISGNITGNAANVTGLVVVANGGTGAISLTGYVKGNGTSAMTASASIPNTDITGLGTMSTQNASAVAITGGTIDGITLDGGTF